MLYSLQDITLIPASVSEINHRAECNPFYMNGNLPLFTAPMSQIVDENNYHIFLHNNVNPILPRNIDVEIRLKHCTEFFCAFSLDEFEIFFCVNPIPLDKSHYVLIDVANGHMQRILDLSKKAKEVHSDKIIIMAGNVANPMTYIHYAEAGIDYIRVSIGSGSQCTTANTGIFYPMGSLIKEMREAKCYVEESLGDSDFTLLKSVPKIVADGGFNTFGDIIKALALGADYVMCGKIFAQTVEACGEIHYKAYPQFYDIEKHGPFNTWVRTLEIAKIKFYESYRDYYGMSTKIAQKEFGKEGNKTEEGIYSIVPVKWYLNTWVTEFTDYLKSAMSYTNHKSLDTFIGGVRYEILSPTAIRTFK